MVDPSEVKSIPSSFQVIGDSNRTSECLICHNSMMQRTESGGKPRVLILGGCGFIGRNLVSWLIDNHVVSRIRIVDKCPPSMCFLEPIHSRAFQDPSVEFISANLIHQDSCKRAFECNGEDFDVVVSLASETRSGQTPDVYREGIETLTLNCARQCVALFPNARFIYMSSGYIYGGKDAATEDSPTEPRFLSGHHKLQTERLLSEVKGLDYVVIRPALVYGPGDKAGIAARLVVAGLYKHLNEPMKLLWNKDVTLHTVHVTDVCRAIWHLYQSGKSSEAYNIVDEENTTQGKICQIASNIFHIKYEFMGNKLTHLATIKKSLSDLTDDINEKHLNAWAKVCSNDQISVSPLSPYLKPELLLKNSLSLNGDKIKATGFKLSVPTLREENLRQVMKTYVEMGLFPKSLLQ